MRKICYRPILDTKLSTWMPESVLKDKEWLVGGKCTTADLPFVLWNVMLGFVWICVWHGGLCFFGSCKRVSSR